MSIQYRQARVRTALFVGRQDYRNDFSLLLAQADTPRVVVVSGPGGIGKTSLLEIFRAMAERQGCPFSRLDARQLPANPVLIRQAVEQALSSTSPAPRDERPRRVLALDHVECWTALDGWLRSELLSTLPDNTIVIIAGRQRASAEWRADAGMFQILTEYVLEPLSAEESSRYLRRRGLPRHQEHVVSRFAHGYPLALAMAASQVLSSPNQPFRADHPDLINDLVSWLLQDVHDPLLRQALLACATVQRLNEPILKEMLGREDVHALFGWLAAQPFVEHQIDGLIIHDLVRELIVHDARVRDLKGHHTLIGRAVDHLLSGLEGAGPTTVLSAMAAGIYVLRHEPFVEKLFPFDDRRFYPDRARQSEWASLAEEVARLEGEQSRSWFEYWLEQQPHGLIVLRDHHGAARALALIVHLRGSDPSLDHEDPAVRALANGLRSAPPLHEDEKLVLVRFLMAHGTHQVRTPIYARLSAHINGFVLAPGISVYSSVAGADHEWSEISQFANMHLLPDSSYRLEGHEYCINGHDNRQESALAWVRNSVMRILGNDPTSRPESGDRTPNDKAAFDKALVKALRAFHDPYELAHSPLLKLNVLRHHSGKQQPDCDDLRRLLCELGRDHLVAPGARGRPGQVLTLAHFEPVGNQQLAADALHVSERTFRRYLRDAETALANVLWLMETGQCQPPVRAVPLGSDSTIRPATVRS